MPMIHPSISASPTASSHDGNLSVDLSGSSLSSLYTSISFYINDSPGPNSSAPLTSNSSISSISSPQEGELVLSLKDASAPPAPTVDLALSPSQSPCTQSCGTSLDSDRASSPGDHSHNVVPGLSPDITLPLPALPVMLCPICKRSFNLSNGVPPPTFWQHLNSFHISRSQFPPRTPTTV